MQIQLYREILQEASQANYRARGTEIRILPTIQVADWQSQLDELCRQLRLLDNLLAKTNWETDLLKAPAKSLILLAEKGLWCSGSRASVHAATAQVALAGAGARLLHCYAPRRTNASFTAHCYYRTLTAAVRAGMGQQPFRKAKGRDRYGHALFGFSR